MGLVSIIIRTYNRGYCVEWSIKSALYQSYRDLEVLIIDDGSTDNTAEVVAQFDDPRIRYVYLPHNGNVAELANIGLHMSTGDYIAFLDSDDMYLSGFVETLMDAMRVDGTEVAFSWIGSHRNELATYEAMLAKGNGFQGGAFIASRRAYDIIGDYDTDTGAWIDDDITWRFARVFRVTLVPEVLELMSGKRPDQMTQQRSYIAEYQMLLDKWAGEIVRVCGPETLEKHRGRHER